MQDYPSLKVETSGYQPDWSDGTEVVRAENGEAWLYRKYDDDQITLTIRHPNLTWVEESDLRQFYNSYKHERVRFLDPRSKEYFICMMPSPPKNVGMSSPMLANIEITLLMVAA